MAPGRRSRSESYEHGTGGGIYAAKGSLGDGFEHYEGRSILFSDRIGRIHVGMAAGQERKAGRPGRGASNPTVDGGVSGKLCTTVPKFLYGTPAGGRT